MPMLLMLTVSGFCEEAAIYSSYTYVAWQVPDDTDKYCSEIQAFGDVLVYRESELGKYMPTDENV